MDQQKLQGGGYGRGIAEVAKGLSTEPTYLLVFGIVLVVSVGLFAVSNWQVSAMAAVLGLLLASPAMILVERRKRSSIEAESPEQHRNLERLRDDEVAAREIFESIASNETDTWFVYSSMVADSYFHEYHKDRKLRYPLPREDSRVTALPDAHGIAKVHTLLTVAGKKDDSRLHICTASEVMRSNDVWEHNLILIGSHNANEATKLALGPKFNSPYYFNETVTAIEDKYSDQRWPQRGEEFESHDYGLIVKLKIKRNLGADRVYLILAGIGAIGTRSACYYLHAHITELREKFATKPFGIVLKVDREIGNSSITEQQVKVITEFEYTRD